MQTENKTRFGNHFQTLQKIVEERSTEEKEGGYGKETKNSNSAYRTL